jgi:hypothetical protein
MWLVIHFIPLYIYLSSHAFALIIGLAIFYVFARAIYYDCQQDHENYDHFTEHLIFAVGIALSLITILENVYVYHGYAVIRPCLLLWL